MDTPLPSPLVAIVGQTASGKSALAMRLAQKYNGEIICADSRTIYKGMDIGTAKPSAANQATVRHHLLDIVEPGQTFTAADFKALANEAIVDIANRGKLPFLVGGTGLYIDSVLFDFEFGKKDVALRSSLEKMSDPELYAAAKDLGISESQINFQNRRHLTRAIERGGVVNQPKILRPNTLLLGVDVEPGELTVSVHARIQSMLARGLEREVKQLSDKWGWESAGLSAIGYKQWQAYFAGEQTMEDTVELLERLTLQYAKRQRTWFNRNSSLQWINSFEQADRLIHQYLLQ
jgi:tRNA dimethylallyltransferase